MNDQERADWLARTIDELLHAARLGKRPAELDGYDVDGLLRAAGHRLAHASDAARSGLPYEGLVWRKVIQKLDRRKQRRPGDLAYADLDPPEPPEPSDPELDDLADIALMRQKMAERLSDFADAYKEEVWADLQKRIDSHENDGQGPSFFFQRRRSRRNRKDGDKRRHASDSTRYDPEFAGLIATAGTRRRASAFASQLGEARRERIWQRITANILEKDSKPRFGFPSLPVPGRPLALAGAAAVLVIAAVGPMPATGLADHPAAAAVRLAGNHLGVTETSSAPAPPDEAISVAPFEASAAEASELLGATVIAPETVAGFDLASSLYFPEAPSAADGGVFVLAYTGAADSSLTVYLERANGTNFAAAEVEDVVLPDGTTASYIEGGWTAGEDGGLVWDADAGQSLLFEEDGLRAMLRYSGPDISQSELISLAESFR